MDEYSKAVSYGFDRVLSIKDIFFLNSKLHKIEGINSLKITPVSIQIKYDTLRFEEESLKEIINGIGYPLSKVKPQVKGIFKRFIDKLGRSNQDSFGRKKLDCCDLKKT